MNFFQKVVKRIVKYKHLIDKYSQEDTVFIYQMGKVGSTSLEQSIPNAVHIHAFFTKNHTCPPRLYGLAKFGFKHFFYRLEQEFIAYLLRRAFKRRNKTKVITLVRKPMARNISMFFHDIDAYLYSAHTNCMGTQKVPLATRSQDVELLEDVFNTEFNHQYPLLWFDEEFKVMTGINIFDFPFDKKKGCKHIEKGNVEVLCISTNKIDVCLEQLTRFVGIDVQLQRVNQADHKWYSDLYQSFVVQYQPPVELQKEIEDSKFYKHFFN